MPEDRRRPAEAPVVPPAPGSVYDLFTEAFPSLEMAATQGALDVLITVDREKVHEVLVEAKHNPKMKFDFLRDLCGVDHEDAGFEVVYHLYSYEHNHNVTIKAKVPTLDPAIQSATDIWRAADWHERECRDMFGIVFTGHPNLVPILLPEDMTDHFPLRKENPLAPLEEWQGEQLGPQMGEAGHIPPGSGFEVSGSAAGEEPAT